MSHGPPMIPYEPPSPPADPLAAAQAFGSHLQTRRSVRHFSTRPVDRFVIEAIVEAASTAPSGANKQPYRFVLIGDAETKKKIREAAEHEEDLFYAKRATKEWLEDLEASGTNPCKPFLEDAPWLLVAFKLMRDDREDRSDGVYYVNESTGLACGMLLAAAHVAGLATLTHTPSPMAFLRRVLNRPEYERPFLLIPIGWPAEDCQVPDIQRKPLDQILTVHDPESSSS